MGEGREKPPDAFFTRHSASGYKSYGEIKKSDNPQAPFDPENQVTPDLTEKGVELAQEKAKQFFEQLDPEQDALFFVSSNEARALETANIYRQEAHAKEFDVIKPEKTGSKIADELTEGEVRVVKNLSLNPPNTLLMYAFTPEKQLGEINWEAVDEETKQKWTEARKIVDSDDQGSFGANFFKHSEEIKKIFPSVQTANELYEKEFKNLLRLLKWGKEKGEQAGLDKKLRIMAFGHENYLGVALQKYFEEHGIGNCETMTFQVEDDKVTGSYRGKSAEIE